MGDEPFEENLLSDDIPPADSQHPLGDEIWSKPAELDQQTSRPSSVESPPGASPESKPNDSSAAEDGPQAPAPPNRFPSPFRPAPPVENPEEKPDTPAPPARATADDGPRPSDKPPEKLETVERVAERTLFQVDVPAAALDANARAIQALRETPEGQPMPAEVRRRFEQALQDASTIDSARAAEQERRLTEDLQTKTRTLPDGKVLPPWTEQKENEFIEHVLRVQNALLEIPEPARGRVADIEAQLQRTPANEILRRGQLLGQLRAEAAPGQAAGSKVAEYLSRKQQLETFTAGNADGLIRRNLHQQEMSLLHSKAIVSGLFAIALDRSGRNEDRVQTERLVKDALSDRFAVTNLPEILQLKEKYRIVEEDPLHKSVPGRAALRRAVEIMQDPAQGTMQERLEKATPFFEQAIGASDQIDMADTDNKLKDIAREAAQLGEDGDAARLAELDEQAIVLLEKLRQPGLARMAYAFALNNVAVEANDRALNERALNLIKALEQRDPGAKFDPLVQGARLLASENPPGAITEKLALEVGAPEVERLKREAAEQGKQEEMPFWRQALGQAGELAVGMAVWYAASRLFRAGREGPYRAWQAARRIASVEVEGTPSLRPGEAPRLVIRDAEGREREVTGVRKEDGRLRVKDGEKTEAVKLRRGERLILKVAPDANLSPQQVREAAGRVLAPTRVEEAVQDVRNHYESQLRQRELEIEQMRRALDSWLTREDIRLTESLAAATTPPAAQESARPRAGDRVQFNGEAYQLVAERGNNSILYRTGQPDAAVAEPISQADLAAKYEEIRLQIDGREEVRLIEKAHPEKGLFRVTEAAGQKFIAPDASLSVVSADQVRPSSTPGAPARSGAEVSTSTAPAAEARPEARPVERVAPERGPVPVADRLTGTNLVAAEDGTLRREEVRVGEMLSLERVRNQTELNADQIDRIAAEAERLKQSDKEAERKRGADLERTVKALRGELGAEAKAAAHKGILDNTRRELEARSRSGRGASVGVAVGIGILVTAALAWYLSEQRKPESPLRRSSVGSN